MMNLNVNSERIKKYKKNKLIILKKTNKIKKTIIYNYK